MTRATTAQREDLGRALKAARRGRPVFIRQKGRNAYVLLTARGYRRLLARLEDLADLADAERALREFEATGEKAIPWEQAKRELGLE